jgi:histidinol-phosphate aminotransferase
MKICDSIKSINPYQGGKPISELKRELGLKSIAKLASNENPLKVSDKVLVAINKSLKDLNRYPDGNGFELKQAISNHLSVNIDQITLGNGSNDIIELVARLFICNQEDEVILSEYAFAIYKLISKALNAKTIITPAKNYGHDLENMQKAITKKTKLIFIANPNNPTGTFITHEKLYKFIQQVPKSVAILLDQAYFEYLKDDDNAIDWLKEFNNLIITRTFSKAYGLAGLRVGYAISSSKIANYLNRIRQPFNVNSIAQSAAIASLLDKEFLNKSIAENKNGLLQLSKGFDKLDLEYIPSYTNFIAVKVNNPNAIYQKLLKQGFIVRVVEMKGYLRVSVGSKNENILFLNALKSVI